MSQGATRGVAAARPDPFRPVWHCSDSLVIVKPAGVSSEGANDAALETVRSRARWPDARLPHRLDRITRGFLLIARDAAAVARHNEAIRDRLWRKVYLARLRPAGEAAALLGPHKAYLKRDGPIARVVRSGGDPSFLEVVAVAPAPERAGEVHAVIRLLTGRYHQIRAMMAGLAAPLAGDRIYGDTTACVPTLEHAVFGFPTGDGTRVTLWNAQDPDREPVASSVVAALAAEAGIASATT